MVDYGAFSQTYPQYCDPDKVRIPGLGGPPSKGGASVADWTETYAVLPEALWSEAPPIRPLMQERGAEAFGTYLSFRLDPDAWGVHLQGGPLVGLAREIRRVLQLGFPDVQEIADEELIRQLAFRMAYDVGLNHLAFHAAVDGFTAAHEVAEEAEYYGPYQAGPYAESLETAKVRHYNPEEALANVVSLRSYFNPNLTVELGDVIHEVLDDDGQYRWNAYLMSGNLTTELTYVLRAYPAAYGSFTDFFRRRGEVGPYAHMAIQYDLQTEVFNEALRTLAGTILGREAPEGIEKEMLAPVNAPIYLVSAPTE